MAVCCSSVGATLNDEQQHNKKITYIIDKYLVLAWALAFISSALLSFVCFADANRLSTKKKMKTWKHTSDGTERAKNYQSVSDLWTNERVSESGLENIALATANHGNNWCIIICRCARHFFVVIVVGITGVLHHCKLNLAICQNVHRAQCLYTLAVCSAFEFVQFLFVYFMHDTCLHIYVRMCWTDPSSNAV